ncbi:MAG: succinate dehydrogenase, cytochrome b556 subunit [Hellea sp.]|nr:succinate dehydrogenase, cytochrome b556 subunit [Hellea sp.]
MASKWNDERPMAPHLQVWRWHPAMLSSILHRICAIISYAFLVKVAVGLLYFQLAGKVPFEGLLYSPLGYVGFFIGFFGFIFMALAQLRHLFWDQGKFFEPTPNNMVSWLMILLSIIGAAAATYMALGG